MTMLRRLSLIPKRLLRWAAAAAERLLTDIEDMGGG
jgi:hypothetical protein